jgi:hypothetical protein
LIDLSVGYPVTAPSFSANFLGPSLTTVLANELILPSQHSGSVVFSSLRSGGATGGSCGGAFSHSEPDLLPLCGRFTCWISLWEGRSKSESKTMAAVFRAIFTLKHGKFAGDLQGIYDE